MNLPIWDSYTFIQYYTNKSRELKPKYKFLNMNQGNGGEEYVRISFCIRTSELSLVALHILKVDERSDPGRSGS